SGLDYLTIGRVASTTIRGETTATSTFAGGIQGTYLNVTGTSATSTFARGIDLAGGCFSINGTCVGSSGSGVSLNGVNTWTNLQTFGAGASTTALSGLNSLTVGRTGTTTILGDTSTSTFSGDILARGISAWSYLNTGYIQATSTAASSSFQGLTATSIGGTTATSSLAGLNILSGGLTL